MNDYLREVTGQDFTAKDFRTWAGTVLAALALREFEAFDSQAEAKKNLVRAIESVAKRLGNTPTVCRKCYIHPAVIDAYLEGSMIDTLQDRAGRELAEGLHDLRPEEAAVLALLQQRLRARARARSGRDKVLSSPSEGGRQGRLTGAFAARVARYDGGSRRPIGGGVPSPHRGSDFMRHAALATLALLASAIVAGDGRAGDDEAPPKGQATLTFSSNRFGPFELLNVGIEGKDPERVVRERNDRMIAHEPAWSSGGKRVVFSSWEGGASNSA